MSNPAVIIDAKTVMFVWLQTVLLCNCYCLHIELQNCVWFTSTSNSDCLTLRLRATDCFCFGVSNQKTPVFPTSSVVSCSPNTFSVGFSASMQPSLHTSRLQFSSEDLTSTSEALNVFRFKFQSFQKAAGHLQLQWSQRFRTSVQPWLLAPPRSLASQSGR